MNLAPLAVALALSLPGSPRAGAGTARYPGPTSTAAVAGSGARLTHPASAAPPAGEPIAQPADTPAIRRSGPELSDQAQPLRVQPDPSAGYRAVLRLGDVLSGDALREAVRSGIPLRLRVSVELWHDRRFFDELSGSQDWSTVLFFEPLEATFALREPGNTPLRRFPSYQAAAAYLERSYTLTLRPQRAGNYYYTARVDIETLSLSDLQELEHWLKGELGPAVGGESSVSSALADGVRRLFVRVLGMPSRRYEARSSRFKAP